MRVPTRLSIRNEGGKWTSEGHPSFEHALMRWMSIPLNERRGGLLSPASAPEPRLPSYAEISKVKNGSIAMGRFGMGLLCVDRDLARRMRHRIVTELSGLDIDSADEYPRVTRIVAFGHEIDERRALTPQQAASWRKGIAKLMEDEAEEPTLVFPRWGGRGAPPPPPRKPAPAPGEAEDADWVEVADEAPAPPAPVLALPAPRPPSPPAGLLRAALAMIAAPGCGAGAGSLLLKAVPESFADDAAAAAWARTACEVLREFGGGLAAASPPAPAVAPVPEPVPEPVAQPEPEPVPEPEMAADTAEEPEVAPEPVTVPAPEPAPAAEGGKRRLRPVVGAGSRVTGLRKRVWETLSPSRPMRKAEVARAMNHGRGAIIRAVEELVALGAAEDRGGQRYVKLPIRA